MYHQENNSIQRHSTTNWILIYHCLKSKTACVQEENVSSTCQIVSWFSKTNKYQSERAWSTITGRKLYLQNKVSNMVLGWLVWHQLMINVEVISIRTTLVPQKQTAAPSMYDGRQAAASRVDRHSPKAYSWRKGQTKYRLFESFFKLILWMKGQVSIGSKKLDPPIWYPSSPWEVVTSRVCVWGGGRGQGKASYSNFKCEVYVPKKFFLSVCAGGGVGWVRRKSFNSKRDNQNSFWVQF